MLPRKGRAEASSRHLEVHVRACVWPPPGDSVRSSSRTPQAIQRVAHGQSVNGLQSVFFENKLCFALDPFTLPLSCLPKVATRLILCVLSYAVSLLLILIAPSSIADFERSSVILHPAIHASPRASLPSLIFPSPTCIRTIASM